MAWNGELLAEALNAGAVVFQPPDRAHVELTGPDRAKFLHGLCSQNVKALSPGSVAEAFFCNVKSHILAHVALAVFDDVIWLESVRSAGPKLTAHFDRYQIREEVAWVDRSDDVGQLWIAGPKAGHWLREAGFEASDSAPACFRTERLQVRPLGGFSVPVWSLVGELGEIHGKLLSHGAAPGDSSAWNAWRIEEGWPVYDIDLSEECLAQEAGRTAAAISFNKGCYLGQEPIARIDALGHVNRLLRRIRCAGDHAVAAGTAVVTGAGELAGTVSSAATSLDGRSTVALAMLRTKLANPGDAVIFRGSDGGPDVRGAVEASAIPDGGHV